MGERPHDGGIDLADLDWSAHLVPPYRRPIGQGIHLADAIDRIGRAMIESWHAGVIASVALRDIPEEDVPDPDVGFERDGVTPIDDVHRTFGPAVRRVLSPGRWASLKLKNEDRAAWEAGHRPDPRTGVPTPAGEMRAAAGEDASDPISYDNWLTAYRMSAMERGFREVDVSYLDRVVMALIRMHGNGIVLTAGPGAGAPQRPIDPASWDGSYGHRMQIVASCTIDAEAMDYPDAQGPLPVFADEPGFDAAVQSYGNASFVESLSPDHPFFFEASSLPDGATPTLPAHRWERIVQEALAVVEPILGQPGRPERLNWRRKDLEKLVRFHPSLSRSHLSVLPEVRARLLKQERFAFLGREGQPRKEGRLVEMADEDVVRVIRDSEAALSR